jgi:hypothetical protein
MRKNSMREVNLLILQAFFAKSTCATERFLIIISTDDAASFTEGNATEEDSWL